MTKPIECRECPTCGAPVLRVTENEVHEFPNGTKITFVGTDHCPPCRDRHVRLRGGKGMWFFT